MRSFLYLHTANVAAARGFYSELLGLDEIPAAGDTVTCLEQRAGVGWLLELSRPRSHG